MKKKEHGFTLIELLVVVAIVCVLTATAGSMTASPSVGPMVNAKILQAEMR